SIRVDIIHVPSASLSEVLGGMSATSIAAVLSTTAAIPTPTTKGRNLAMEWYKGIIGSNLLLAAMAICLPASAAQLTAKTAILVHGAFADGSSWQKVIPYLEKAGLKVIAVQNPLDSLENDVATTKRAIRNAEGPVVLVGHSWAGVVITEAGSEEKVKSLVY